MTFGLRLGYLVLVGVALIAPGASARAAVDAASATSGRGGALLPPLNPASSHAAAACGNGGPPPSTPRPDPSIPRPDPASQQIVACGVNLTGASVSDWGVGACGTRRVDDPRVFGPETWRTLHRFAAGYPPSPSRATLAACAAFLTALPSMLPCSRCGADFAAFLAVNEAHAGTPHPACRPQPAWGGACTDLATTCGSRAGLVSFLIRAHDNVNALVNPCREPWTPRRAAEAYGVAQGFCASTIVVGNRTLCRAAGDRGCVEPSPPPVVVGGGAS